jgi:hypothetical protein
MIDVTLIPPLFGIVGLLMAWVIYGLVMRYDAGSAKVQKIGDAIHLGAMVFMRREYTMLSGFAAALLVLLYIALGVETAIAFVVGALSSALAGWIGMYAATKANVRTTTAAHTSGAAAALTVAFFGGSIMGLTVASMGLLGLGFLYLIFGGDPETAHNIHGFGMGASVGRAVLAGRRRHLHQERRRRRRPGGQGRGRHPRGRPAQPRRDRRQRRRQRRRRRRHGLRHLRELLRLDDRHHRHRLHTGHG